MPLPAGGLHFMVGPLLALAVVGAVALVMRWALADRQGKRHGGGNGAGSPPIDTAGEAYGLLEPVAVADDGSRGAAIRSRLGAAGIRSTLAPHAGESVAVLVFREDAARARRLVGSG